MPYTVYKVTNKLTGDFYIGVHKTSNPMDDYLGSGKVIRQQVALHGPENFTKEILFCFSKKGEAYEKEAELVNPLLGTPGCLNLHPGGHGGFGYINAKGLCPAAQAPWDPSYQRMGTAAAKASLQDPVTRARWLERLHRAWVSDPKHKIGLDRAREVWRGQRHSQASRYQMSLMAKRRGKSSSGRCRDCVWCGNQRILDSLHLCARCNPKARAPQRPPRTCKVCPTCGATTSHNRPCAVCISDFILSNYTTMSQSSIASHLGVSQPAVSQWFSRLGIKVDRLARWVTFCKDQLCTSQTDSARISTHNRDTVD